MKNIKKTLFMLFVMTLFCSFLIFSKTNYATTLSSGEIFIMNGYTITESTTISDINKVFGSPKVETVSAFGGEAYSYYDDDLSYYFYVETNSLGVIKSIGAAYGNFVGKLASYGDEDSGIMYSKKGTTISDFDTDEIYGIFEYKATYSEVKAWFTTYNSDPKYLLALQPHAVAATKVINNASGLTTGQESVSEEIFYTNVQLENNGSYLLKWAQNNNLTNYVKFVRTGTSSYYSSYPNPITCASLAEGYSKDKDAYKYLFFDFQNKDTSSETYYYRVLFINEDFMEEKETIELTDEEENLLKLTKAQYEKYTEIGESIGDSSYYDEEPVWDTLPLVAGKWTTLTRQLATEYLNIARVGMGEEPLTLSEEISDCAQHKATLVMYMNNVLNANVSHVFDKPDDVDQDFYDKAMSYMNENLYMGNVQTSIINALNDGYGDAITCGHRYNLLEPTYTTWGVGSTNGQGCHKFSGYKASDLEVVAWPSKGIFPTDMASNGIGNWTVWFQNGYKTTEDTTVTIKCLNTGKEYTIEKDDTISDDGKFYTSNGSLYTFRDDSIVTASDDVYEITLHNVKDTSSNLIEYTYRSVFKSLASISEVAVEDIELSSTVVNIAVSRTKTVAPTVVPEDATDNLVRVYSEDESIATVRADGLITGVSLGITKIHYLCDGVEKTVTVNVEDFQLGDMNTDGYINSTDAALVLDCYKNGNATEIDYKLGDMDENGILNSTDAAMILDIYKNS